MAAVPQDILDRIRSLERQVRELTGRSQMRPALDKILHGDIVIGEGGQLIAETPDGTRTFVVGQTPQGDWGVGIGREDGTSALTVGDDVSDRGQMIRIWSRDRDAPNRILIMDDYYSDRFLGRPWLPFPMYPTANSAMENTTSWQFAWIGRMPAQNAVAVLSFSSIASAGGQARITYVAPGSSERVLETWTLPTNTWVNKTFTVPLDDAEWGDGVLFQIEHRNSASTGAVETRMFHAYTRNTYTEAEAPDLPTRTAAAAAAPSAFEADLATTPESPVEPGLRRVDE
ncbi:hypothetical protein ACH4NC_07640 [Streptomyces sp. NPDC017201]|uniref:hypothetical protein n=1 Tax=Streptomyces sp. NPDC017201 TaxID=3364980 RepID=UPI0037A8CA62